MKDLIDRLTTGAEMMNMGLPVPPAVLFEAAAAIERLESIREAAENLRKLKGRHHSQSAYERMENCQEKTGGL